MGRTIIAAAFYGAKPYDRRYFEPAAGHDRYPGGFMNFTHEALAEIARVTTENILRWESGQPFLPGTTL